MSDVHVMIHHVAVPGLFLALMVTAHACERGAVAAGDGHLGARVSGSWTIQLFTDRLPIFARDAARGRHRIAGTFAFVQADADPNATPAAAAFGVYDLDFTPLGLPHRRGMPAATLLAVHQDSVEIRLDPTADDAAFVLRGQLRGDSILGTWTMSIPRLTETGGRFAMARRRP